MLKYRQILGEIKEKKYKPVYLLMGEEAYFIDIIADYIAANVLDDAEKEFNQTIIYGKEATVENVISTVKSYPMMSSHRVVIIREAQQFKDLDKLEAYLLKPVNSTILVICHKYGTIDKRKKIYKSLSEAKHIEFFVSKALDDAELVDWIIAQFKVRRIRIEPKAAYALKELLGNELNKIFNEITKLSLSIPEGSEVRLEEISNSVGGSRDYNVFEFQGALARRNVDRIYRMVQYFARDPYKNPMPLILGTLYSFFSKLLVVHGANASSDKEIYGLVRVFDMTEFKTALKHYNFEKVRNIIGYLHECDLRSKGINNNSANEGDLLKELVFKILH